MAEQRRGLPRTPGGEPWPPAGTPVPEFRAAAVVVSTASDAAAAPSALAPAIDVTVAASAPPTVPPQRTVSNAPRRRGLGHTPAERFAPSVAAASPVPAATVPDAAATATATATGPVATQAVLDAAAPDVVVALAGAPRSTALSARRRVGLGHTPAESPTALTAIAAAAARLEIPRVAPSPQLRPEPQAVPEPQTPATSQTPAPVAEPVPSASVSSPSLAPREPRPFRRSPGKIVLAAIGVVVAAAIVVTGVRLFLFHSDAGASFLKAFPGTTPLPGWAPVGQPLWTQWQHWLNAFFIVLIIKTGWTIRTQKKPSASWTPRGGRKKISIELFTHLSLDVLWLANGLVFWVLLFATGQFIRIVPSSWAVFPNALSAALQYASLWSWPTEDGWVNYNSLQVLTYFATVFLAAPLAAITGFRMSPLWQAKWRRLSKLYPADLARKIHFPVMVYFVLFVIVHVVLVLATGALRNLNHMFWGSDSASSWAGFIVFVIGIAAIVAAWFVLKPIVMQQLGSAFGKVGR